jgi:N-acetylglucosamine-6-phosphate deacetylase
LCPTKNGCHEQPLLLEAPNAIRSFEEVYGAAGLDQEGVKIITAAPDVKGVLGSAEELRERGVTLSIGHR